MPWQAIVAPVNSQTTQAYSLLVTSLFSSSFRYSRSNDSRISSSSSISSWSSESDPLSELTDLSDFDEVSAAFLFVFGAFFVDELEVFEGVLAGSSGFEDGVAAVDFLRLSIQS